MALRAGFRKELGRGLLVAFVALASWFLVDRFGPRPEQAEPMPGASQPDYYLKGFEISDTDVSGALQHRMVGVRLEHFAADDRSEITAPRMTVYRQDAPPWFIEAERGVILDKGDTVHLLGDVYMHRKDPQGRQTQIFTQNLHVKPNEQYAETAESVTVRHPQGVTEGRGMQANMQAGKLSLLSQVKGHYEAAN